MIIYRTFGLFTNRVSCSFNKLKVFDVTVAISIPQINLVIGFAGRVAFFPLNIDDHLVINNWFCGQGICK